MEKEKRPKEDLDGISHGNAFTVEYMQHMNDS